MDMHDAQDQPNGPSWLESKWGEIAVAIGVFFLLLLFVAAVVVLLTSSSPSLTPPPTDDQGVAQHMLPRV
jgi:hypothetical protein